MKAGEEKKIVALEKDKLYLINMVNKQHEMISSCMNKIK